MQEVHIHDVGLRDGLQNIEDLIPTENKTLWAEQLIKAGIKIIQLGSFVNPKKVYQMSDTDDLFEYFNQPENRPEGVIFSGLVLNERGFERGMESGVDMFCMGVSASETHSQKNTGMSTTEATERIINIAKQAHDAGKLVQCSVQSAFGCGFEGDIAEEKVYSIVEKYLDNGIKNISLADTAGHANPAQVERMFSRIREMDPDVALTCHFHNTYGMGMANCLAALNAGVTYFETAFGGLGGCPFTKSPSGNVATEDLVHMLQEMGIVKELKLDEIIKAANYLSGYLVKDLPGYVYKTGVVRH